MPLNSSPLIINETITNRSPISLLSVNIRCQNPSLNKMVLLKQSSSPGNAYEYNVHNYERHQQFNPEDFLD